MLFFKKPLPSLIAKAKDLLRLSAKVRSYRQDLLNPETLKHIQSLEDRLESLLKAASPLKAAPELEVLQKAYQDLDQALRPCGGKVYPVSAIGENVEMFFVAALVALGIRTFFFQPFKIPTNSMYPTYAGFLPKVYRVEEESPKGLKSLWRTLMLGATQYRLYAPKEGALSIAVFPPKERQRSQSWAYYRLVKGRKYGLLPETQREYYLFIEDVPLSIRVPEDVSLDDVFLQAYFPGYKSFQEVLQAYPLGPSSLGAGSRLGANSMVAGPSLKLGASSIVDTGRSLKLDTGQSLKAGQSCLSFEIQSGDMLFVSRMAYHFTPPKLGDPIVFRTGSLEAMHNLLGAKEDKYYIKRLVGLEGDVLKVKPPILYRNHQPIQGAKAFENNAKQTLEHQGYQAYGMLTRGRPYTVPSSMVYAMGDNSAHSFDSRYWGPVPKKELIGRAAFVFYPFSSRWGRAQ